MQSVKQLVQTANQLANAGRWEEAERAWLEVRRFDPQNPQALFSLGVHALKRGEVHRAYELLSAARGAAPKDLLVTMTFVAAARHLGKIDEEREAIESALILDPYFLPALLAKASWFERQGELNAAKSFYGNALKVAPPQPHWPVQLQSQLAHAHEVVSRHQTALDKYLRQRVTELQERLPPQTAERWQEAVSIMSGASKPFRSECNQLHVPRLPAIPFFDRAMFPWVAALEAQTDAIREELLTLLAEERERFAPYVTYRPGEPVNQWVELNQSLKWSAFHLWRGGTPIAENLERCPRTAAALASVGMAEIGGLCPNAMFSALAPHTHIPPHNGETNARVIVHLPLIVPEGCLYRVGFEQRQWRVGEALIFDDTIEHEARNDSDELRVVLIFDVWNPLLEPAERDMVNGLAVARRAFDTQEVW